MRTQITTLFFAFVLIVALLAGCGQSAETTTAETTTTEMTTTEMTTTEVATEAPAPTAAAEPTEAPAEEPTKEATSTETAVETENGQTTLPDIYTFSLQQPETEAFAKAVERLDLIEKLQSEGPFTAFIPSTNAFARLPESLLADDDQLMGIILFHLVADTLTTERLFAEVSATSVLGDEIAFMSSESGAVVENANVLGVTDQISNGILYIVDNVMLPPNLAALGIDQSQVVGEENFPTMGNLHIDMGARSPVAYNSMPPTSGPHYPSIVAWEAYEDPIRYEHLVHNLEDGGVVIYYQCEEACPELVNQLNSIVQPYWEEGKHIVLVPNVPTWTVGDDAPLHQDIGASIAVTSWQKLLKLDAVDAEKIQTFIETYEGIDHHAKY